MDIYYLTATAMLISGIFIRYNIGRRRFYRRHTSGLQQFKSYKSALFITFIENFLMLLTTLLIVGSILVFAWGFRENHVNDKPYDLNKTTK